MTGLRFSRSELHLQSRSWPGQRFGSAVLAGLALLVWLLADGVSASEESALLTGHGLKEFNAERYEEALRLFEQAVTADPMDVEARYQRGVTSGRLGKAELAIGDLSFVLEQRPKHMQAALELGIAFVSAQRYREAEAWLRRAQEVAELDAHSSFFLGLSQLHLDELADARQNFERAARNEELLLASRYYLGVIHYRLREWDEARVEFAFVAEGSPDSYMGGEANRYLNFIQQIAKTYWVHADLGVLYDSNVVLAPTDGADAVVVSNEGDGLVTLAAGGAYWPWRTEHVELSIGYEFYQSLHFNLSDFDLQDHRPSVEFIVRGGNLEAGITGRYDYDLLDGDGLLQQPSAFPWVRLLEGRLGYTEVFYWFRWRDYVTDRFSDTLDADRHATGIQQRFNFGSAERQAWLGYRFDRNDARHEEGQQFSYDRQEVGAGLDWKLPRPEIEIDVGYWFNHDDYDEASAQVIDGQRGDERRDDRHTVSVGVRKALTDHFVVTCGYQGIFNGSNQSLFEYVRNIGAVGLEVGF